MGWNLTRRQAQYLRKIEQLIEEYDHSPTYQDIGDAMGTTRQSVYKIVHQLEARGYLQKRPPGARNSIKPTGRLAALS